MKQLRSEIEIHADPADVWRVLTDFERYGEWNPYIVEVTGVAELHAELSVKLRPPGGRGADLRPTVTELRAGEVLEWWGHVGVRGIFDGRHHFELHPTPEGGTVLEQRETFTGLLVPFLARSLDRTTPAGFDAMNAAIKARAERLPAVVDR